MAAYGLAGIIWRLKLPSGSTVRSGRHAEQGAFERLAEISKNHSEARWLIWRLAWHIFVNAPITGVGIGEFAGAAFSSGLPPGLTQYGNQV